MFLHRQLSENGITLTRFILTQEQKDKEKYEDLAQLMNAIQTAVKAVSNIVRRAGLNQFTGSNNFWHSDYYEQKLEQLVNELIINMLKCSYTTCVLVSAEEEDAIIIEKEKQGKYIVCIDPLDGTSNIEGLVPVGTIFSIFKKQSSSLSTDEDALQCGRNLVAAGYALYGSATTLVLSLGCGVQGFILDPTIGEFVLTEPNMRIPEKGRIYSINEGYSKYWYEPVRQYVHSLKYPSDGEAPYMARYIGAMVADVHRTLKYGGIFMYPSTKDCPKGKLRLMYECIPMAFLVEQAGGKAITVSGSPVPVLDVRPESIHQRMPVFLGSSGNVDDLVNCFEKLKNL